MQPPEKCTKGVLSCVKMPTTFSYRIEYQPVADPGFPMGGGGGHGPLMWALFGKNERIGSHRGHAPHMPPRSANANLGILRLASAPGFKMLPWSENDNAKIKNSA